jgi:hypothetical protein
MTPSPFILSVSAYRYNIEVQIGEKFLSFTDPPTYTVHIISMVYFYKKINLENLTYCTYPYSNSCCNKNRQTRPALSLHRTTESG